MGHYPNKTATVTGSTRQQAEIALTMHQAGKNVEILYGDECKKLRHKHDYTLKHRDTFSRFFHDGVVHAELNGDETIRISDVD